MLPGGTEQNTGALRAIVISAVSEFLMQRELCSSVSWGHHTDYSRSQIVAAGWAASIVILETRPVRCLEEDRASKR